MIRNIQRLSPLDGRQWLTLRKRVSDGQAVKDALEKLDAGRTQGIPPRLILEGATHADCLIHCEKAVIWIEGKRFDWLSPSIQWDVTRDQLARNMEAVWMVASEQAKDHLVIICHEHGLKHHEEALLAGYRTCTWSAGLPHIVGAQRREFGRRVGTVSWSRIVERWPPLRSLPELADLETMP